MSRSTCTPFFCVKEEGSSALRALFDCRLSNMHFQSPAFTHLVTIEALSRMRVPPGRTLFAAGGDLKDYYYQFRITSARSATSCLAVL